MDTSNSPNLDFTLGEMRNSQHPEEVALAENAFATIRSILEVLRPIMKYLVSPMHLGNPSVVGTTRLLILISDGSRVLALNEEPRAVLLDKKGDGTFYAVGYADNRLDWEHHRVSDILLALERALSQAKEKREQHLAALAKQQELLRKINALIGEAKK